MVYLEHANARPFQEAYPELMLGEMIKVLVKANGGIILNNHARQDRFENYVLIVDMI